MPDNLPFPFDLSPVDLSPVVGVTDIPILNHPEIKATANHVPETISPISPTNTSLLANKTTQKYDPQTVLDSLHFLDHASVDGVTEVRIIPKDPYLTLNGKSQFVGKTITGYYTADAYEKAASDLAPYDGKAQIYFTLNPCSSALRDRACNRLQRAAKVTTADPDILCRQWLPLDFDPQRPAGISATDAELQQALNQRDRAEAMLRAYGVPAIKAMSGNGGHLLVRLPDYPNNSESTELIKKIIEEIARLFSNAEIDVDRSVYNAARVWKVYGTLAVKGDDLATHPHRRAFIELPCARPEPFDIRTLDFGFGLPAASDGPVIHSHVSATRTAVERRTPEDGARYPYLDVDRYLTHYGVEVRSKKQKGALTIWEIPCPFNSEHNSGEAHIQQETLSGKLGAACKHNSCAGKGWAQFKEATGEPQQFYSSAHNSAHSGTPYEADTAPGRIQLSDSETEPENSSSHSSSASKTASVSVKPAPWPEPLEAAAFHGLAGRFVKAAEPHTESDAAALLVQFLVATGVLLGRMVFFQVEASKHFLNLFAVLVGASAKARKGTSMALVKSFLSRANESWVQDQVVSGLSSGEGLIYQVRDALIKTVEGEEIVADEGVSDKRVLVVEEEFASPLKIMAREGNILSTILRAVWDTGNLRTLTKTSPMRATGAHIAIIGHITSHELQKSLRETEAFNGFANRFLWICVRRSKLLPHGGGWREVDLSGLVSQLQSVIDFVGEHGRAGGELRRDAEADALWEDIYRQLSQEQPGLLGAVTSRAEAQVMRLACIYAVLDCSPVIRIPHLQAGLAVWRYAEASAAYIFGNSVGDPLADRLLAALQENGPEGLSKTDLSNGLGRNVPAQQIEHALNLLKRVGAADCQKCADGKAGRPVELWIARAPKAGHRLPSTKTLLEHHRKDDEINEVNEKSAARAPISEDQPNSLVSFVDSSHELPVAGLRDDEEVF